jgi:hypothetical protein
MICLYTTLYDEPDKARLNELLSTLKTNIALDVIDKVYILNERGDVSWLKNEKVQVISINQRPLYSDFFELINLNTAAEDLNIIANTDIFFDNQIELLNHISFQNQCIALSRWNILPDGSAKLFNRNDSQDVWIFKGQIRNVISDFPIGIPFCDNRILYELQQAGYNVLNPAYSIKTYHLHVGERAEYDIKTLKLFVEEPYRYLYPHNLYNLPKTIIYNVFHKRKIAHYRYDLKKMNRWIFIRIIRKICEYSFHIKFPLIGYK